jgi:MYXO-CTERM domain-containing protein
VPARRTDNAWASLFGLALLVGFGARRRRHASGEKLDA